MSPSGPTSTGRRSPMSSATPPVCPGWSSLYARRDSMTSPCASWPGRTGFECSAKPGGHKGLSAQCDWHRHRAAATELDPDRLSVVVPPLPGSAIQPVERGYGLPAHVERTALAVLVRCHLAGAEHPLAMQSSGARRADAVSTGCDDYGTLGPGID